MQGSDTVVGRNTNKHPTIEAIRLLCGPCFHTAYQVPWVGVGIASVAFLELIIEVCFKVSEEFPATVVVGPHGRVIQSQGPSREVGYSTHPVLVREVDGDNE